MQKMKYRVQFRHGKNGKSFLGNPVIVEGEDEEEILIKASIADKDCEYYELGMQEYKNKEKELKADIDHDLVFLDRRAWLLKKFLDRVLTNKNSMV